MNAKEIIRKWYEKIGFPSRYDADFHAALNAYEIDTSITVETYDLKEEDGKKNFLYFLYFCEAMHEKYREKGIPDEIFYDNLTDMPRWLNTYSELKGELYFGELDWFWHSFTLRLFKLGRLQFNFTNRFNFPTLGIGPSDTVLNTHIPADGPLTREACLASFAQAKVFFEKYFPETEYKVFACHSWLLGDELCEMLGENSNILQFRRLFTITEQYESDSILSYTVGWKKTRKDLSMFTPRTQLESKVKKLAMKGFVFHGGIGYIEKSEV